MLAQRFDRSSASGLERVAAATGFAVNHVNWIISNLPLRHGKP